MLNFTVLLRSIRLLAVVGIGILVAILVKITISSYVALSLGQLDWMRWQQASDRASPMMTLYAFNAAILFSLLAAVVSRWSGCLLFLAAAILALAALAITTRVEWPLRNSIDSWALTRIPSTWSTMRYHRSSVHLTSTLTVTLAFVCAVIGLRQANIRMTSHRRPRALKVELDAR